MSAPQNRRVKIDVMKLIASKFQVKADDDYRKLMVKLHGPPDTPYEGGVWQIRVLLPENYPFQSPSVGFVTQIFHPNVDQSSGSICLDVLNQKWTALYDLVTVFETFLPQLLRNPNPKDPLNHCAAFVLINNPVRYRVVVAKHVKEFATADSDQDWELYDNDLKMLVDCGPDGDSSVSDLSDDDGC